jgi:hypothetical protein
MSKISIFPFSEISLYVKLVYGMRVYGGIQGLSKEALFSWEVKTEPPNNFLFQRFERIWFFKEFNLRKM